MASLCIELQCFIVEFIKTANALRKLNNFHLLMAFNSAFNSSPLLRLKWTLGKLSKSDKTVLKEMEALLTFEGSYKVYRDTLKSCTPPAVPYM